MRQLEEQMAYQPVKASDPKLHCCSFIWKKFAPEVYVPDSNGAVIRHRGGGDYPLSPAMGDLAMRPGSGKYYYQFRVNTDGCRVGVCTGSAYPTEVDCRHYALGKGPCEEIAARGPISPVQSPTYLQSIGAVQSAEDATVAYWDAQSGRTVVNGREGKQLWREFTPTSGALYGFLVDTDEGVVQLFIDKLYAGLVFGPEAELKGKTLFPCVGISGSDTSNRSIGTGRQSAVVFETREFDGIY